ncbi:MAG: hypothetical protein AAGU15_00005 [Anaerolineaceae bacterium]|jgi:hypothetical protein
MRQKFLLIAVLVLVIAAFLPFEAVSAKQVRTPGLSIFVIKAPKDLKLFIQFRNSALPEPLAMERVSRYWETYYNYYYQRLPGRFDEDFIGAKLIVRSSQYSYELPISKDPEMRPDKRLMTLDLKQGTLVYGEPDWRAPLSVAGRVMLTLVLEGAVFYLFGMRDKSSWLGFFILNLITQSLLSIFLVHPFEAKGDYFMLVFYSVAIILVEAAVYYFTFKEVELNHKALLLALVANLVGFFLGGWIMPIFPA